MTVYADNAATTRMSRTALDAMLPAMEENYGNPSSLHSVGQRAAELLMKSRETMAELKALIRDAVEPGRLEDLMTVIEYDLGYELYRAVSAAKVALSGKEETTLSFSQMGVIIEKPIRRADFERWIADDVGAIEAALDRALAEAGLGGERIEAVFMTGGTSYVPAVRSLFDRRFGAGKVHIGDAFRSVASGLALLALDRARASVAA